jgi:hypothetical protein
MTTMSDQEFAETEILLRQRLSQLASQAPTAVLMPDEVAVVAANRPTGRGRRAGVIAAVTALIGAGGFTTYSFIGAGNDGGTATPEEAVRTFASAMDHEDVLGMIDVTLPEEVSALRAAVDSITSDAKRVGLLADSFDAGDVDGLDISVDDLALETNFLEGGLAAVTVTSGTVNASFDPKTFSFGNELRLLIGDDSQTVATTASIANPDSPVAVMTVERDGRWYVSVEYTLAELIRQSNGWEVPGPVTRSPVGFDTPAAAATGFYERLASLDFQSALDTIAPGEDAMAWLAQSWLAEAQAAIERGRVNGWTVAVSDLTYETIGEGDHVTLKPLTFKVEGTVPDQYSGSANPALPTVVVSADGSEYASVPAGPVPTTTDGLTFSPDFPAGDYNFTNVNTDGTIVPLVFPKVGPQPFTVERADDCTTFTGDGARGILGTGGSLAAESADGGFKLCGTTGLPGVLSVLVLTGGLTALPDVSVVQVGGKWYVSPLGTVLATAVTGLHDVKDGASLFDSPIAPYIYGGLGRADLESVVVGRQADTFDPACLPALSVEDGVVTAVVADPSPDAIRVCTGTVSFSDQDSSSGSATAPTPATVAPVPETTLPPASTAPPASTP